MGAFSWILSRYCHNDVWLLGRRQLMPRDSSGDAGLIHKIATIP